MDCIEIALRGIEMVLCVGIIIGIVIVVGHICLDIQAQEIAKYCAEHYANNISACEVNLIS